MLLVEHRDFVRPQKNDCLAHGVFTLFSALTQIYCRIFTRAAVRTAMSCDWKRPGIADLNSGIRRGRAPRRSQVGQQPLLGVVRTGIPGISRSSPGTAARVASLGPAWSCRSRTGSLSCRRRARTLD